MSESKRTFSRDLAWSALALLGLVGVLVIDINTELGFSAGTLYVLVVLISALSHRASLILAFGLACSLATLVGYWLSPPHTPEFSDTLIVLNRVVSIAAIAAASLLAVLLIRLLKQAAADRIALERGMRLARIAGTVANLGGWSVLLDEGVVLWSDEICRIHGEPPGFSPSLDQAIAFYAPEYRARITQLFQRCAQQGEAFDEELQIISSAGQRLWVRASGQAVRDNKGDIHEVQGAFRDISDAHAANARLRLLEAAVSRLNDVVLITEAEPINDPGPSIVFVNEAFERCTGYTREEAIGRSPRFLQGPKTDRAVLDRVRHAMERWQPVRVELLNYTKSGQEIWLEMDIVPLADETGWFTHWVSVERDVTERRRLAEQMHQSQRMESLGQLTGGIAHDFNNLLTVIQGNAELLTEQLGDRPKQAALAQMIDTASQRGAQLTHHLLAFARKQPLQPCTVNIDQLIAGMDHLLRRSLGEHIHIELLNSDQPWLTLVDPAQLESALLNLCLNARDAMPKGGRLLIETANVQLDDDYVKRFADLSAGDYVMLAVTDNGIGIAADVLPQVFEPFFTTKEMGKGTGLGLSMVYGFVKQSHGHARIYSELGEGTTVKLYIPRFKDDDKDDDSHIVDAAVESDVKGGGETILLVEDDRLVREFSRGQLLALGYRVLEAGSGREALDILAQDAGIDLLFTDMMMPGGLSGKQLADAAVKSRPDLKVLFTSGYTENAIIHHGRLDPGVQLLSKPYRLAELASAVRQALS